MDVAPFVSAHGGVCRTAVLLEVGVSRRALEHAIGSGRIAVLRKGWLRSIDAPPDLVRAVAGGGRLGCLSAATARGLWTIPDGRLHISMPRHASRTQFGNRRIGEDILRHWDAPGWRSAPDPIEPMEQFARQIVTCTGKDHAIATLDSALERRLTTIPLLERALASLPAAQRSITSELDAGSQSGLESLCRVRLRRAGYRVRTQVAIPGVGRVDLLLGDRLIIEADGRAWHQGADAFQVDRSRDLAALRLGYVPLRLTSDHVLHEWQWVERVVGSLVARGEHVWRAAHRSDATSAS